MIIISWIVAAIAVLLGTVLFTSIPTQLGVYRNIPSFFPHMYGHWPAFHHGIPWKYTWEELYASSSQQQVAGQTAIVTGANAGIGYEISLALARLGVHVIMACRNSEKCQTAAERIRADATSSWSSSFATAWQGSVTTMVMDTSSLSSVKAFAEAYWRLYPGKPLDVLYLNAGTTFTNITQKCVPLSEDGIELLFATNYLGHHLLYRLLEPALQLSPLARVVQTSSISSFGTYSYQVATDLETLNGCREPYYNIIPIFHRSYGQSKLAQILWVKKLTRLISSSSLEGRDPNPDPANPLHHRLYANAFHPGSAATEIWSKNLKVMDADRWTTAIVEWLTANTMWSSADGALTGLFLGVAVDRLVREDIRGQYFHPQAYPVVNPMALNETLQDALWDFSERLIQPFLQAGTLHERTDPITSESTVVVDDVPRQQDDAAEKKSLSDVSTSMDE